MQAVDKIFSDTDINSESVHETGSTNESLNDDDSGSYKHNDKTKLITSNKRKKKTPAVLNTIST